MRRKREGRRERRERRCSLMSQNCLCHLTMLTFRLTAKTSVHYTFVLGLHSRGLSVSSTPPHYSAHPGSPASGLLLLPTFLESRRLSSCCLVSYSEALRASDKTPAFWLHSAGRWSGSERHKQARAEMNTLFHPNFVNDVTLRSPSGPRLCPPST